MRAKCSKSIHDPAYISVTCTRNAGHLGKHGAKLRDYVVIWNEGDERGKYE